jgi:hypothetical protein
MAHNEQLEFLRAVAAREQQDKREQPAGNEADERNEHKKAPKTGAPTLPPPPPHPTCPRHRPRLATEFVHPTRTTSYTLRWDPGADHVTRAKKIVYDVYQASARGGEDFTAPTYTTAADATSFVTPPLPADQAVFFVVRARDVAGNRDSNKVERQGQNLCV